MYTYIPQARRKSSRWAEVHASHHLLSYITPVSVTCVRVRTVSNFGCVRGGFSFFRSLLPSEFLYSTRRNSGPFPSQFTVYNDNFSLLGLNNLQYKQSWLITYDPKHLINDFRVSEHWVCEFQHACISVGLCGWGLGDELIPHPRSLKKHLKDSV
jgi:hypothetical protein